MTALLTGRSAVLLFLILVPGSVVWSSSLQGHDFARVLQVLLGAICAVCIAIALVRSHQLFVTPVAVGMTLLAALALASILAAPDVAMATREGSLFLGLACVVAVVARRHQNGNDNSDEVLAATVGIAAALYSSLVLMAVFINLAHGAALARFGLFAGYDNYRFFNHVQTAMLPLLAIAASLIFRSGTFSRLAWFGLVVGFALLMFSGGRATALSLLSGGLLALLVFRRAAFPLLRNLSVGAVAGLVLYIGLFVLLPSFGNSAVDVVAPQGVAGLESDHSRFFLWKLALADIRESPWLGIGPMHYAHFVNGKAAHPHNIYLQVAAEWGVPMLLGLMAASGWGLWRLSRAVSACNDPEKRKVGIGLFIALVAIAVDGVFSGNFVMPVSQVWIAVVIGWAVAWTRAQSPVLTNYSAPPSPSMRRLPRGLGVGVAVILCASQIVLFMSVWPEFRHLDAHLKYVNQTLSHEESHRPRFWSDGWF